MEKYARRINNELLVVKNPKKICNDETSKLLAASLPLFPFYSTFKKWGHLIRGEESFN